MNEFQKVGNFAQENLITVKASASLAEAYDLMIQNRVRHLPVEELGEIIGILSERDLLRAARVDGSESVADSMSVPVLTLPHTASIRDVAELFLSEKISSVIVTTDGQASGIVTTDDLLRVLIQALPEQSAELSFVEALGIKWAQNPMSTVLSGLSNSGV
jgi:acetoin utilization protein AcuB